MNTLVLKATAFTATGGLRRAHLECGSAQRIVFRPICISEPTVPCRSIAGIDPGSESLIILMFKIANSSVYIISISTKEERGLHYDLERKVQSRSPSNRRTA